MDVSVNLVREDQRLKIVQAVRCSRSLVYRLTFSDLARELPLVDHLTFKVNRCDGRSERHRLDPFSRSTTISESTGANGKSSRQIKASLQIMEIRANNFEEKEC